MHKKSIAGCLVFFFVLVPFFGQSRLGADNAAPKIASYISTLSYVSGTIRVLSDSESLSLLQLAASNKINVFELLDCIYRTVSVRNIRIAINGESLRKLDSSFDFGGERILAILPIDKLEHLEIGALLETDDKALDIFLVSAHESRMEIGNAYYQKRFGFESISPLLFASAYGVNVRKFVFSTPLEKLELYAPGKGAIYVGGMSKPKRWNLDIITDKHR